jgi:hypothetical protein
VDQMDLAYGGRQHVLVSVDSFTGARLPVSLIHLS